MANFCTNCGNKLGKNDNFCTECGTKLDNSNKLNKTVLFRVNQLMSEMEKEKIKMIDEIFESGEIKSEIMKIGPISADYIKDKIIHNKENMSEDEIRYFIKTELKKQIESQKIKEISKNKKEQDASVKRTGNENFCGFGCKYFHEEFLDENGGMVDHIDPEGAGVDYYCDLGHSVYSGNFCEYYEK